MQREQERITKEVDLLKYCALVTVCVPFECIYIQCTL